MIVKSVIYQNFNKSQIKPLNKKSSTVNFSNPANPYFQTYSNPLINFSG